MFEGLHAKMSALARRKSTITTSYFGSRVELILNVMPSGETGSRGTYFVCSVALKLPACLAEESRPSLANFSRFATSLIERQGLGVLHALDVAVECVLDRRAHGDDTLWPRHLHLEVGVVRDRHELGVAGAPKDGVACAPEPHHLEGEGFLVEIVWCAEPDWQINLPEGLDALA
jgi:hypothetical protein